MRFGSAEWYSEKYKRIIKETAKLKYRDKLKVYLSLSLGELRENGSPLYDIVKKEFPEMTDDMSLDEARMTKLFKKVFMESSMKALELTYRLDGSLSDITNEPDFDELEEALKEVK